MTLNSFFVQENARIAFLYHADNRRHPQLVTTKRFFFLHLTINHLKHLEGGDNFCFSELFYYYRIVAIAEPIPRTHTHVNLDKQNSDWPDSFFNAQIEQKQNKNKRQK